MWLGAVTPVFQPDPEWIVLGLFALAAASLAYVVWVLLSELFWMVYEWWRWRE